MRFKAMFMVVILILMSLTLSACGNDALLAELESKVATLEAENAYLIAEKSDLEAKNSAEASKNTELTKEINSLKAQNTSLKNENDSLNSQMTAAKEEKTVQDDDVVVLLTSKSTKEGSYGSYYVTFKFSVSNNTDKPIKGVQGIATFKDIFGIEIMPLKVDFTGIKVEPGESIIVDDLYLDANQFMDDHVKLYGTKYDDIKFEYKVTAIVFSDGTSKSID